MKKYIKYLFLFVCFLMVLTFLNFKMFNNHKVDETKDNYIAVTSSGFQLMRNGEPYFIKGVSGNCCFDELHNIGGNTIRVYDTINLKYVLDEAKRNDLSVIVDIPLPINKKSYNPYLIDSLNVKLKGRVTKTVNQFKNHPALLMWNLGNELNYPFVLKKNKFINTFNSLIDIIHEIDPNHLVGTTISGTSKSQILGIYLHSSNIDVIGFNVFGSLKDFQPLMSKISWVSKLIPYYISEWGIHGPWEAVQNEWSVILELNSTEKAMVYKSRYEDYIKTDNNSIGSLAFYWGTKIEGTPTWFNIFEKSGKKSQTFYTLNELWNEKYASDIEPPQVIDLYLDNKVAEEGIVLKPSKQTKAHVLLEEKNELALIYKWQIYKEGWGNQRWIYDKSLNNKSMTTYAEHSSLDLIMPKEEGPYRLFVYIYDQNDNFSTANIPFYILDDEQ